MAVNQRLDNQRQPRRSHKRISRPYKRGYKVLPHAVWGDKIVPPATGATAGIPGTWTPAGSAPPASVAGLMAGVPNVITASPTSAWTTGQYVQTATAGAPGRATWTGSAWVGGAAPLELDQHVEHPENYTIADIETWVDANPDQADELLATEQARSTPRITLVDWLQGFISHRDEGTIP